MTAVDLNSIVLKKTGAKVMPVVVTPQGEWLQDTREIINEFEKRFPPACDSTNIIPKSPKRRLASLLLEAWGDEYWIPMAMHYRWNYPESVAFFRKESMASLIPPSVSWMVPSLVKNRVADQVCKVLIGFLPTVGVRAGQTEMLETWTDELLFLLDEHFAEHNYLLGGLHPTIGDFGLAGPVVNHLTRDPAPLRLLFGVDAEVAAGGGPCTTAAHVTRNRHVYAWAQRMQTLSHIDIDKEASTSATTDVSGDGDDVPATLEPVLFHLLSEFIPLLEKTAAKTNDLAGNPKFSGNGLAAMGNRLLPRNVGDVTVPLLEVAADNTRLPHRYHQGSFTRGAIPFNLWKMQCILADMKETLDVPGNRRELGEWLDSFEVNSNTKLEGGDDSYGVPLSARLLDMDIPALKRENVRVKLSY